jgi:phosphoribosylformylglycinamidine synthase subunit PurQ / glutaminase
MKCKVIVFPGSNCDSDCYQVLKNVYDQDVDYVWHKETRLGKCDLVVLPGGFSYGDYLRTGAIARFSPIMNAVMGFANKGGAVIGICNGFQILLESGLLPGAMLPNRTVKFICRHVFIKAENRKTMFTKQCKKDKALDIPIAHGEGNYFCDDETLKRLIDNKQIAFTYCSATGEVTDKVNPNGSRNNIAGIVNEKGNVLGMMPHPERASEAELGSTDGKVIWDSIFSVLK